MIKALKAIISSLVSLGLVILAACTCPNEDEHKKKVVETIRKEIKRSAQLSKEDGQIVANAFISGMASIESTIIPAIVKRRMIVDEFWLFSIGTINDSEGPHLVSIGVFNTVFVFPMYLGYVISEMSSN